MCFSFIIYMVYSLLGAYTNMMFENPILKYIAHPCSHFIFIIMIYCFNGFLFWSEKKARIGRSIYREKNEKKKNVICIMLTLVIFVIYFVCAFYYKGKFMYIPN